MFSLTNANFWLYSLFVNAKSLIGFDSLLTKRTPPLSGFFISMSVIIYLPFVFFWAGILGRLRSRRSLSRSVNPIYPPAPCLARVAVFSKPFKQRSINHD